MKQMCKLFLMLQATIAFAGTITVPATAGPWDQTLNPSFSYGVHDNDGPVIIDAAQGFSLLPGTTLTVKYESGLVSAGDVHPFVDANGETGSGATNNDLGNGGFPAHYMGLSAIYLMELVGTFAQDGVIVGMPFPIGDGPVQLTVPGNANELLLGINDNFFKGNAFETNKGSFVVSVSPTPEPGTWTLLLICSGLFTKCRNHERTYGRRSTS